MPVQIIVEIEKIRMAFAFFITIISCTFSQVLSGSNASNNNGNCSYGLVSSYPYCNQALSIEARVSDLLSRMNITEKIANLENVNPGVPRLGVPSNRFHEALHGVNLGSVCAPQYNGNTGCATSFPHATLLGATFNRSLWSTIGEIISTEARGFKNSNVGGADVYYWTPNVNLFRDPRWGRGQETPGEDPYLTSQYGMEYIKNMQYPQTSDSSIYLKVVSTGKHYADYDQEGSGSTNRESWSANVTQQDQVEYYWPAWRAAIQSGGVSSIMCALNAVNGVPACGDDYFMNQVARNEWGFDGYFVSDCGSISDGAFTTYIDNAYGVNNSISKNLSLIQAKVAIEAGCDIECGSFYGRYLYPAYQAGLVSQDTIDTALGRLYTKMFETGKMDDPIKQYYNTLNYTVIDTSENRQVALDAGMYSVFPIPEFVITCNTVMLLQNDNIYTD